jgi:hypothetical protein
LPTSKKICPTPRVCQILLGKSCVLPTSKKVCQVKKRVHLQQFGIIHLPNSDLTYIRNPERNKIIFMPFTSWKLTSGILLYYLFLFFTLLPRGKRRWQPQSARSYMRVGR